MSVFLKINYNEVRSILNKKKKEEPVKEEGEIKYYNFPIMDLIEKINLDNYIDFGFSKVLAAYFDIPINTFESRVTLEDFNKINQTISQIEKYLNDEVKTDGTFYLARHNDSFSIMYYEVLS